MLNKVMRKIIFVLFVRKRFQKTFEVIHRLSLIGMNIGGGGGMKNNGERNAMNHVCKQFKSFSNLVLFDVGANVGDYSKLLGNVFGEKAEIHSFEPSIKTFQKLKINVGGNERINLYNFGFGNENNTIALYTNFDESGLASVYRRRLDHFNIEMDKSEKIEIKTLDTFCSDRNIKRIHFLKLDVEGHEIKVLEGSRKILEAGGIDFIQFEFGGCNIDSRTYFQDFYYLLKDKYKIYRIVKDGLYPVNQYKEMYEAFITTNYLAERK